MKIMKTKKGFTIVELSLSLIFLSILLVSIAILTARISSIYEKGLTIKTLNATGGELADELVRAISKSPVTNPSSLACGTSGYMPCLYKQRTAQLTTGETVPTNGVFCSGRYSFIWNTGYALNSTDAPTGVGEKKVTFADHRSHIATVRNSSINKTRTDFKMLRIFDEQRQLCMDHATIDSDVYETDSDFSSSHLYEILDNGKEYNNMVIYDLQIFTPTYQTITNQAYYSGTFTMATLSGDISINAVGDYCKAEYSDTFDSEFPYCAINKFNFASRAIGVF